MNRQEKTEAVKAMVIGKWDSIFPYFGVQIPKKGRHAPCPSCGGSDRFKYDDKYGNGNWICNNCTEGKNADGIELLVRCLGKKFLEVIDLLATYLGLDSNSTFTEADRKKIQQQAEQYRKQTELADQQKQDNAAILANQIWQMPSHDIPCPYLDKKKVKNFGCKINKNGSLVIPVRDVDGKIWSLQLINKSGRKDFLPDGRVGGCFHVLGEITDSYQIVCIAEGYATAASIHEATGYTTIAAFNANNILPVAIAIYAKYPDLGYVYCADDDSAKTNAGLNACNKALDATGGIVILPDFSKVIAHE